MKSLESIERRFSCRDFSKKKVKWHKVLEIIDAGNKAPFAGNINNLKFIIISDENKLNILSQHSNQDWMSTASNAIVVCSKTKELIDLYGDLGEAYSRQQAGASIQNMLIRSTDLKIGSCWIGSFAEDLIKRDLKIPEDMNVEAIIVLGYPRNKIKRRAKKVDLDKKIFWEKWGVKRKP